MCGNVCVGGRIGEKSTQGERVQSKFASSGFKAATSKELHSIHGTQQTHSHAMGELYFALHQGLEEQMRNRQVANRKCCQVSGATLWWSLVDRRDMKTEQYKLQVMSDRRRTDESHMYSVSSPHVLTEKSFWSKNWLQLFRQYVFTCSPFTETLLSRRGLSQRVAQV